MSHTTKALVSEVIVDQVRDQGTKAWSVRNLETKPSRVFFKCGWVPRLTVCWTTKKLCFTINAI